MTCTHRWRVATSDMPDRIWAVATDPDFDCGEWDEDDKYLAGLLDGIPMSTPVEYHRGWVYWPHNFAKPGIGYTVACESRMGALYRVHKAVMVDDGKWHDSTGTRLDGV